MQIDMPKTLFYNKKWQDLQFIMKRHSDLFSFHLFHPLQKSREGSRIALLPIILFTCSFIWWDMSSLVYWYMSSCRRRVVKGFQFTIYYINFFTYVFFFLRFVSWIPFLGNLLSEGFIVFDLYFLYDLSKMTLESLFWGQKMTLSPKYEHYLPKTKKLWNHR